jgi:hypothetical protein
VSQAAKVMFQAGVKPAALTLVTSRKNDLLKIDQFGLDAQGVANTLGLA